VKHRLNKPGIIYLINTKTDTLTVKGDISAYNESIGMCKVYFNNKDYSEYVKKLNKELPLVFVSSKILIFSKEKAHLKSEIWKCKKGTIFIPKETELTYIEASDIEYSEKDRIINGRQMNMKVTDINGNLIKNKKFEEFSFDSETDILANKIIPPLKIDGSIYYMNSRKNTLSISEGKEDRNNPGKIYKIFFNNDDYTYFLKGLLSSKQLAFASGKILIFSDMNVEFKSCKWMCAKGIVFIPRKVEVMFLDGNGIIYDEEKQILTSKDSTLKIVDLENKIKEQITLNDFSLNLNEK
jgi:hypothetical protein